MLKIINKNLNILLNIFLWLFILPLLFVLTIIQPDNIFTFNFSDIYINIYFIYFLLWFIFLILFRFLKISNNIIKEELLYSIKFIVFITVLYALSSNTVHHFIIENSWNSNLYFRAYWKVAFFYFALALIISPIVSFIKNNFIRENLLFIRKILWILAFIFTLKHWIEYFSMEYLYHWKYYQDISFFDYVYKKLLDRYDALSWVIVWILMMVLWLTSNKVSVKLFWWKWWKLIQSLVYPTFLLVVIHVALSSRFDKFYIALTLIVVWLRTISYFSQNSVSKTWKTTKYICIPCWYIYDEAAWDPDSWLEPGTKFEDIPDDWYCPVCWVSKADFEPYFDEENDIFGWYLWEVVWYNMLVEDVLELSLKVNDNLEVLRGQYAILLLNDFDWEFSRAYSIVEYKNNIIKFWIKLKDTWRWWRRLKTIKIWDTIKIKWIYWDFVLIDTENPKVFIATWTWLSPIINMISWDLKSKNNKLFFWVQKEKDLFYLDKINNIKNLETYIYLSREEVKWYKYWRIDLSKYDFDINTEFYICWNPALVESNKKYLSEKWFKNVYSEKF